MTQASNSTTLTLIILLPLIGWRIYKRFRSMVGRQRLSVVSLRIRLIIFPLLLILLSFGARTHPEWLWWLAGGVGLGSLLGLFGLSKTRFEPAKEGLFYTPNAHLGIALSLLFVGRVIYRVIEIYASEPVSSQADTDFARSPLTLAVFGVLAGYYVTYAIGLVRWRSSAMRTLAA